MVVVPIEEEEGVILVSGGHYSQTRNLEAITLARENHVDIVYLPPHNSHKMLRLDKAFLGHLKIFYCEEIEM
jgi:hypothetical protein